MYSKLSSLLLSGNQTVQTDRKMSAIDAKASWKACCTLQSGYAKLCPDQL
jgi:hypothetical protein